MPRKPTFRIEVENRLRDRAMKAEGQVTELQATNQKLVEALKKAKCVNPHCRNGRLIFSLLAKESCPDCANRSALIGEVEG